MQKGEKVKKYKKKFLCVVNLKIEKDFEICRNERKMLILKKNFISVIQQYLTKSFRKF